MQNVLLTRDMNGESIKKKLAKYLILNNRGIWMSSRTIVFLCLMNNYLMGITCVVEEAVFLF